MRQVALRIYALLFLVELILRVLAEGCPFFWSSPNVLWNYLDTHGGSRLVGAFCPHFSFLEALCGRSSPIYMMYSRPILGVKKRQFTSHSFHHRGCTPRRIRLSLPCQKALLLHPTSFRVQLNLPVLGVLLLKTQMGYWPSSVKVVFSIHTPEIPRAFKPEHSPHSIR